MVNIRERAGRRKQEAVRRALTDEESPQEGEKRTLEQRSLKFAMYRCAGVPHLIRKGGAWGQPPSEESGEEECVGDLCRLGRFLGRFRTADSDIGSGEQRHIVQPANGLYSFLSESST